MLIVAAGSSDDSLKDKGDTSETSLGHTRNWCSSNMAAVHSLTKSLPDMWSAGAA